MVCDNYYKFQSLIEKKKAVTYKYYGVKPDLNKFRFSM